MANWWDNETSAQNVLKDAMKDALKEHGVATSDDTPSRDVDSSVLPVPGSEPGGSVSASQTRFLETAVKIPDQVIEAYKGGIEAIAADASGVMDQLNDVHAMYGNVKTERDDNIGAAADVLDRLNKVKTMYLDGNVGTDMAKNVGIASNYMSMHYENETEAFEESERILGQLVTEHASYIGQIEDAMLYKLPAYTKALGASTSDIATIIENSISLTGDANTTMMDDIAKFSEGLANATGVPLKSISKGAVQIVTDIKLMGDVSAEEATRMSATFAQLGMKYDEATSVFSKFQEFGSSADTAGMLSQLTGGVVNLDAVELMELASEKPEEFLDELRDSMLSAGFDVDAYLQKSRAEQLLIAEGLGFDDQAAMARFLRGTENYNQDDLKAVQEETEASDKAGYQSVIDQLDLAAGAFDGLDKIIDHHRANSMYPLEQDLIRLAVARSETNNMLKNNIELTDAAVAQAGNKALYQGLTKADEILASALNKEIKLGITDFGKIFEAQNKATEKIVKDIEEAKATEPTGSPAPTPVAIEGLSNTLGQSSNVEGVITAINAGTQATTNLAVVNSQSGPQAAAIVNNAITPGISALVAEIKKNNATQQENSKQLAGNQSNIKAVLDAIRNQSNSNKTFEAVAPISINLLIDEKELAKVVTNRTFGVKHGLPGLVVTDGG